MLTKCSGHALGGVQVAGQRLRQKARDLLHAQPQERHMRRSGEPPVDGRVERRHQIVRPRRHHIGADTVEEVPSGAEHRLHQPGTPRQPFEHQSHHESWHAAPECFLGEALIIGAHGLWIVWDHELGMGDVNHR
jgi:hypothetical protein